MSGVEAVPRMTSKECRNFHRPDCNKCAQPRIPTPVSAPCRSLAELL
jgi:hypothetical protein